MSRAQERLKAVGLLVVLLGGPVCDGRAAPAAPASGPVDLRALPAEVAVPNTRRIAFASKADGRLYAISIALPFQPPPAKGYRVVYVLDGDAYFDSMAGAVRTNGNAPDTVVVGIGYPDTPEFIQSVAARHGPPSAALAAAPPFFAAVSVERVRDLTVPATDAELAEQAFPRTTPSRAQDVGGVDAFLRMIETEVKPRVEALAPIDRNDQTLFGHSLGGLAVIQALFTEPGAFRNFVAASPSIWWNHRAVLEGEPAFVEKVKAGAVRSRVLITVGELEQHAPTLPPEMAAAAPTIRARITSMGMVDSARGLAERLRAVEPHAPEFSVEFAVFEDQQHGISPWPAIGRAVAFLAEP